jgi:hypothetical protein
MKKKELFITTITNGSAFRWGVGPFLVGDSNSLTSMTLGDVLVIPREKHERIEKRILFNERIAMWVTQVSSKTAGGIQDGETREGRRYAHQLLFLLYSGTHRPSFFISSYIASGAKSISPGHITAPYST